jgi:glyoxylase I family protein
MPRFDAVLFDFDGVLADSEPLHYACWAEALAPLGVALSWEFFRDRCVGLDDREMMRLVAAQSDPPRDWETLWTRHPAKKELFSRRMLAAPPFAPGIGPLLEELHGAYRLAVVTSSARTEIEPALAAGALLEYFDVLVCGREAERLKPAPDPYQMAARLTGANRPLVVEDSAYGIASGRAAGFEVLVIPTPADTAELLRRRLLRDARPACYNPGMIQGIEHTAIASPDPHKLAQWYVERLGFVVNYTSSGSKTVFVKAPDGSMIEIIEANQAPRPAVDMKNPGLRHLALKVDDFDAAYARLQEANVSFLTERATVGGNTTVFFTDCDGNILHLLHRQNPLP